MKKEIKNVMVVDDDSVVHYLTDKALASFCWVNKKYSAYNGREAIQLLENYCRGIVALPDLILLDIHMPIMDGIEFMECFNRLDCPGTRNIVIAVFTSSYCDREKDKLMALGVDYIYEKPICIEKLRDVIYQSHHLLP